MCVNYIHYTNYMMADERLRLLWSMECRSAGEEVRVSKYHTCSAECITYRHPSIKEPLYLCRASNAIHRCDDTCNFTVDSSRECMSASAANEGTFMAIGTRVCALTGLVKTSNACTSSFKDREHIRILSKNSAAEKRIRSAIGEIEKDICETLCRRQTGDVTHGPEDFLRFTIRAMEFTKAFLSGIRCKRKKLHVHAVAIAYFIKERRDMPPRVRDRYPWIMTMRSRNNSNEDIGCLNSTINKIYEDMLNRKSFETFISHFGSVANIPLNKK
jgi:hypothetical protein